MRGNAVDPRTLEEFVKSRARTLSLSGSSHCLLPADIALADTDVVATYHNIVDVTDTGGYLSSRIEIYRRSLDRRRWTVEQKLAALRDSSAPGGRARSVCKGHEVASGSTIIW